MATDVTSVTESLDRIADALEGRQSGGGSSEPIIILGEMDQIDNCTLNKTYAEIRDNFLAGKTQIVRFTPYGNENDVEFYRNGLVLGCVWNGEDYCQVCVSDPESNENLLWLCNTPDDYPYLDV